MKESISMMIIPEFMHIHNAIWWLVGILQLRELLCAKYRPSRTCKIQEILAQCWEIAPTYTKRIHLKLNIGGYS